MTSAQEAHLPVVNQSFLFRFWSEREKGFGCNGAFVSNFVKALPLQLSSLRLALTTADLPGALAVIVAVKVSGQTVGAEQLVALAGDVEAEVRGAATQRTWPIGCLRLRRSFCRSSAGAVCKPCSGSGIRTSLRLQLPCRSRLPAFDMASTH